MRYKLICCEVFLREICEEILSSEHHIFPFFTMKMSHDYPDHLRQVIQHEIDATNCCDYDAILLGYGLCGNAIAGLKANQIPLVIPRAHDCCTIFLGSKERFRQHFSHRPSCRWTSGGYMGTGDHYLRNSEVHQFLGTDMTFAELIEKYGEENAEFIYETLKPKDGSNEQVVYIQTPPYECMNCREKVETDAKEKQQSFEYIQGDTRLLHMLMNGQWPEDEFLVVSPGCIVEGVYDQDVVIAVKKQENC